MAIDFVCRVLLFFIDRHMATTSVRCSRTHSGNNVLAENVDVHSDCVVSVDAGDRKPRINTVSEGNT